MYKIIQWQLHNSNNSDFSDTLTVKRILHIFSSRGIRLDSSIYIMYSL